MSASRLHCQAGLGYVGNMDLVYATAPQHVRCVDRRLTISYRQDCNLRYCHHHKRYGPPACSDRDLMFDWAWPCDKWRACNPANRTAHKLGIRERDDCRLLFLHGGLAQLLSCIMALFSSAMYGLLIVLSVVCASAADESGFLVEMAGSSKINKVKTANYGYGQTELSCLSQLNFKSCRFVRRADGAVSEDVR